MRINVHIETGTLGPRAGVVRTRIDGNEINILIDPTRLSSPQALHSVIAYTFSHIAETFHAGVMRERQAERSTEFDHAQAAIIDSIIAPPKITRDG